MFVSVLYCSIVGLLRQTHILRSAEERALLGRRQNWKPLLLEIKKRLPTVIPAICADAGLVP